MPKISIIIPIYNVEKYLEECLSSVQNQTYQDFEAIMVDDGSQDGSASICKKYAASDSRFVYIHKGNGGVSSARNRGLDVSRGEYLCFVDSDDQLAPAYIETMLSQFGDKDTSLVFCSYDSNGRKDIISGEEAMLDRHDVANYMFLENKYGYQGFVWNKMFVAAVVRDNDIRFDEAASFNEDRLFGMTYVCCMKGCAHFVPVPLYHYLIHDESVVSSSRRTFNPKICSDFETSVKMLSMLQRSGFPRRTINLARDRILDSYDFIRHNMRDTNYANAHTEQKKLREKAISIVGGNLFYVGNRIRRFLTKQINNLVRNKVYVERF